MAMRYTKEVKREIEAAILRACETLTPVIENSTLTCVDVMVGLFGGKPNVSIFIHDKKGVALTDKRDEINGFFDSDKWKNRKNPGKGGNK